jgi:hypothetical protein
MTESQEARRIAEEWIAFFEASPEHEAADDNAAIVARAYLKLLTEQDELRELARSARNTAAAPDYDEEAIRDALWALVDAVLAPPVEAATDEGER